MQRIIKKYSVISHHPPGGVAQGERREDMDKRHFKSVWKEILNGHEIDIRKGNVLYVGCVDTYRATKNYDNRNDCLEAARNMATNMS